MTKITLEISSCTECPYLKRENVYTADSFERPENWFCTKNKGEKIAGYVEWNDKVKVPDWCPIKN